MNQLILSLIATAVFTGLSAQEFVEVSYGASYSNQAYYQLEDDATTASANDAWDIAFTATGFQDGGIFINESSASMGAELILYLAPTNDFADPINPEELSERLLNSEENWDYGAFNSMRAAADPFDYGWGTYDTGTHIISGNSVFVLQLRDESYRKIQIVSLSGTVYTVKHAELDGSDEATFTVDKANFPNTEFAYYSFSEGGIVNDIPSTSDWDLLFTRYSTPLDDGEGGILDYVVTGVLSGPGTEVAQADGVDPVSVDYEDYEGALSTDPDIIGHDWKEFDLGTFMWNLPADRAYFVKTADGKAWKIVFLDFEGSSTGTAVFEKTALGTVNTLDNPKSNFTDLTIFPNPAISEATITFTLKQAGPANMRLLAPTGQTIWQSWLQPKEGFNAYTLPVLNLPAGQYFLELNVAGERISRAVMINQ